MRTWLGALGFALLAAGCGNKLDHPDLAPACDPATMDCTHVPPETGGGPIGGGEGGAPSDAVSDWSGQVLAFRDDYFDPAQSVAFTGPAQVEATGRSGGRTRANYDGSEFQLEDVLKTASNWFYVDPADNQGVLPTLTVIDTRAVKADRLGVGVVPQELVDTVFQLSLSGEASASRAQVVLRVVDSDLRSVPGVVTNFTAEVVAYRSEETWDASETGATDDSGMIFLGNVLSSPALTIATVNLSGTASGRVEIRTMAGATTVVTAVVSPP